MPVLVDGAKLLDEAELPNLRLLLRRQALELDDERRPPPGALTNATHGRPHAVVQAKPADIRRVRSACILSVS